MKEEHLQEDSKPEQEGLEENVSDDLKFVRSAIEKTYKQVNPDTHTMIMWGVICLIGYPAIYFLAAANLHK